MDFATILAVAANQGGGGGGVSLGSEIVVNGSFASGADWTLDFVEAPAPTISGGTLNLNGGEGGNAQNSAMLPANATYRTVFTIVSISTGSACIVAGASGASRSTAGTFTEDIVGAISEPIILIATGICDAMIDNVSVKQIL